MTDQQPSVKNQEAGFDAMYAQAQEARPMLQEKANAVLDQLRIKHPGVFDGVTFELADIKDYDKAKQKIDVRYNGDASQITDLARGRFVVENTEQLKFLENALKNDSGFSDVINRFEQPVGTTGYRNALGTVHMPNGHSAELQIVHKDMMVVDKYMHLQMDRIRALRIDAHNEGRPLTTAEKKKLKA